MQAPNIALIGLGQMGQKEALALEDLEKRGCLRFSSISDTNPKLANYAKSKHPNRRFYTDYKEMISRENPDGVLIAVPAGYHEDIARGCIDYGRKALFIEKPLVPLKRLQSGIKLVEDAKSHGVRIMTGDITCFYSAVNFLIGSKDVFGDIQRVITFWLGYYNWRDPNVDVVDDYGTHVYRNFKYMLGEPEAKIIGSPIYTSLMRAGQKDFCSFQAATLDDKRFFTILGWLPDFGQDKNNKRYQMRVSYIQGSKTVGKIDFDKPNGGSLEIISRDVMDRIRVADSDARQLLELQGVGGIPLCIEPKDPLREELKHFAEVVSNDKMEIRTSAERELEALKEMWPIISQQ